MSSYPSNTWNNEDWLIEQLAEAVATFDRVGARKFGQRLLVGIEGDGWRRLRPAANGMYLPFKSFDPIRATAQDFEDIFDVDEVSDDKPNYRRPATPRLPPRGKWLRRWREQVLELGLDEECGMAWVVFEVQGLRPSPLYVAAISPDGLDPLSDLVFQFAVSSYTEALEALSRNGFLGPKDYEARAPEVFADKPRKKSGS